MFQVACCDCRYSSSEGRVYVFIITGHVTLLLLLLLLQEVSMNTVNKGLDTQVAWRDLLFCSFAGRHWISHRSCLTCARWNYARAWERAAVLPRGSIYSPASDFTRCRHRHNRRMCRRRQILPSTWRKHVVFLEPPQTVVAFFSEGASN